MKKGIFLLCFFLSLALYGRAQADFFPKTYTSSEVWTFDDSEPIFALKISGTVSLHGYDSLFRAILTDADGHEYLLYETFRLLTSDETATFTDAYLETGTLSGIIPASIFFQVINATVQVDAVTPSYSASRALSRSLLEAQRVAMLNDNLEAQGFLWRAGETSVSALPYEKKRKILGMLPADQPMPNLNGAEYYTGGIFHKQPLSEIEESLPETATSRAMPGFTESVDYSTWHGRDWLTPVKNQGGCGACWAFAAVGVLEAMTNLWFNDATLDLDLSEQDANSCGTWNFGGSCGTCGSGGYVKCALEYFTRVGAVDENCFPYSASDETCANKCESPTEKISPAGVVYMGTAPSFDAVKTWVREYGVIVGGFYSWWHTMTLYGFGYIEEGMYIRDAQDGKLTVPAGSPLIGQPFWRLKNSWGTGWGENGVMKIYISVEEINDFGYFARALLPIVSSKISRSIQCTDWDGDGRYYWGWGDTKPASCPASAHPDKDADDGNNLLGKFYPDWTIEEISPDYTLSILPKGKGSVSSQSLPVYYGKAATVSFYPNTGWEVYDVLIDGVSAGGASRYTGNSYTFDAVFDDADMEVFFTPNTASCVDRDRDGYYFWGYRPRPSTCPPKARDEMDCDDSNPLYAVEIDGQCTAISQDHLIRVSAGHGGTVQPSGNVWATDGETMTVTVKPSPGYVVDSVTVDGSPDGVLTDGAYVFSSVTEGHTLHVEFILE